MLKEFKEFALKGNIMDMAVGVIIGGAFQKIVTSLVNDIIMPIISIFVGKLDYTEMVINVGSASIKYGAFITAIIDFLLIALSIFLFVKYMNKLNKKIETMTAKELEKVTKKMKKKGKKNSKEKEVVVEEKPTTKVCPYCFSEIHIDATRCSHCTSIIENKE